MSDLTPAAGPWVQRLDEKGVERVPDYGVPVLCLAKDSKGKRRPFVARLLATGDDRVWQWWDKPKGECTGLVPLEMVECWAEINVP